MESPNQDAERVRLAFISDLIRNDLNSLPGGIIPVVLQPRPWLQEADSYQSIHRDSDSVNTYLRATAHPPHDDADGHDRDL